MANQPQNNLDALMKDPKAASLLRDREALSALLRSPDTQKLMSMLEQNAGGGLKQTADAAARGDTSALMGLVNQVMSSQEGAAVVDRIQKAAPKK